MHNINLLFKNITFSIVFLLSLNHPILAGKQLAENEIIHLIDTSKKEIATYSQYSQAFDTKLLKADRNDESAITSMLTQLGVQLQDLDYNIIAKIQNKQKTLQKISSQLKPYNKDKNVMAMQNEIKNISSNFGQILSILRKYSNFINGHQIANFYTKATSIKDNDMAQWLNQNMPSAYAYPLTGYSIKVHRDLKWIRKNSQYPKLMQKIEPIKNLIQNKLATLKSSNEYKREVNAAMRAEYYPIWDLLLI